MRGFRNLFYNHALNGRSGAVDVVVGRHEDGAHHQDGHGDLEEMTTQRFPVLIKTLFSFTSHPVVQLEHGVVWPRELRRRLWRHQRLDVVEHGIHGGAGGGGAERPAQQIPISKFFSDFFLFVGQSGLWPVNPLKSFLSGRGTQHQFGRPFAYEHASPKEILQLNNLRAALFNGCNLG